MLISSAAAHAITSPIHLFPVVILDYTFLEQITALTGGGLAVPLLECPWINLLITGEIYSSNKLPGCFMLSVTFQFWKSISISDSEEEQLEL